MTATVEVVNGETVIRKTRVLKNPKGLDLAESFARHLKKVRRHRHKWPQPDCKIIFDMHFMARSPQRNVWYAELTVTIPVKGGTDSYTMTRSSKNKHDALIELIRGLEAADWYHSMRNLGARFRVTGCGMEELYHGYL
jgi:hypothetical protein